MSRLPGTSPSGLSSPHAMSEPDVAKMVEQEGKTPCKITQRSKRPRETCCEDQMTAFRNEIKTMIREMGETQNEILKQLKQDVTAIKTQNTSIQLSNQEIEKSLQFLSDQFDRISVRVDSLERERKEQLSYISALEAKVEEMQRSLKSTSVELRNVPLEPSKESKEDLTNLVHQTCKVLTVDLHSSDIKDVYRIKSKVGPSTVVVDFTRTIKKQEVLKNAKKYNTTHPTQRLNSTHLGLAGQQVPIYISESLTQKGRRLLYLARTFASAAEYKYCWSSNGRVFLRKTDASPYVEIKSEADITSLKSSM